MNLRAIANAVTSAINPNTPVIVKLSNGYTLGAGAKQVPQYKPDLAGLAQVQALDGEDLKQVENLNVQGAIRAIYFTGVLAGVIRPKQVGGDLVLIGADTWLVVKVLETWPDWVKAAIVLQNP